MKILFIISIMFFVLINFSCTKWATQKQIITKDTTVDNSILNTIDSLTTHGYFKN